MSMDRVIDELAAAAGIAADYWDIGGVRHVTGQETKRALLRAMGFAIASASAARASLDGFLADKRMPPPVIVARQGHGGGARVSWREEAGQASFTIALEDGTTRHGLAPVANGGFTLPDDLPLGYHEIEIAAGGAPTRHPLILAPPRCHAPPSLARGARLWGIACHLYAVRGDHDWGIGDFSSLAELATMSAGWGSAAVALNPLGALFLDAPERASPYSPSSRHFLNPLYLAMTGVEKPPQGAFLAAAHVDYAQVTDAKLTALAAFFAARGERLSEAEHKDLAAFTAAGGAALNAFARFHAARSRHANPDFHVFLQWLCARQLDGASMACARGGMEIGLILDLPVGAAADGAEVAMAPEAFARGASFGAPPDPLGPQGQDWGMPPYDPHALKRLAYRPFITLLQASMKRAGALRIDHVMGLQRLFWIPCQASAGEGAYVAYPQDDLFAILALESVRNRCLVIGEDLGTVPEGFRTRLAAEGILSTRLLAFSRGGDGRFVPPADYPTAAAAQLGSHDMATFLGFWQGKDIAARQALGVPQDAAWRARRHDRECLIAALSAQGLVGADFPRHGDLDAQERLALVAAAHRFIARTPAALVLAWLDDMTGCADQLNLPGTDRGYPNWRRRLPVTVAELAADPLVAACRRALSLERPR
ncbi:MAG: 4-alpha-glucanotransferase [Pseudomonadota bacterium]